MKDKLCNLHGHVQFSLLDGLTKITELVDYTLELGQPASCITDHGNMASVIDHAQYASSKGQKYIIGFEAYVAKDHKIKDKSEAQSETENKREHLVLLAQDNDAYKRLNKICSIGATEGFYYRPRIDDKILEDVGTKGLIATSACLAGRIAQRIMRDDIEGAERWAIHYYKLFNGEFYLEIQPMKELEQVKVNLGLIEIHKKTGIPIVATSDFHYLKKSDSETHDVLLAVQSRSLMADPNRWKFPGDTFYVMSRQEMADAFKSNGHEILDQKIVELAMDTTVEIANKCNVNLELGKAYLPVIKPPQDDEKFNEWSKKRNTEEAESDKYLRYLSIKGLKEKGKISKEYKDRIEFELGVISQMGYSDYFLIMEDIMTYCARESIATGPARGSAAGSLVAYAVGITKVDPIQYDLLFERFLNPERAAMPDIDSDLCIKNGYKVFNYLMKKYGKEYCCNIATFGRLQLKLVIKDLAKTFGVPFEEVNDFTKSIPDDIKHVDELNDNFDGAKEFFKKYPMILKHARKLEGSPRHVSQHPAGVCVSPVPITDLIAVQNAKDTEEGIEPLYLSQFEKEQTGLAGLVKIDLLKLKNVSEIQEQLEIINKLYKLNLREEDIPFDNDKTWDLISRGDTLGVFQFASNVAIPVIRNIKPRNIEELAAANSFIRPGTSGLDEYIDCKMGKMKIKKLDPRLDKHLEKTYGAIVFQEQIMSLISELMGISFGEADLYRRALEKPEKDKNGYVKNFNDNVVRIASERGFNPEVAELVRKLIIDNSGYAFNKSHAVAYSIISYWTAYLKANYPVVFYNMMFNGNIDELGIFMNEAKKAGLTINPPHVNYSNFETTIEDLNNKVIRIGLNAIKGVGSKAAESIIKNKPYKSIDDFFVRNELRVVNKKVIEALVSSGAFDSIGLNIELSDIPEERRYKFDIKFETLLNGNYIYLSRGQLKFWYDKYNELATLKSAPNYAIPISFFKVRHYDEYELTEEKDGTIVVPEDRLSDLELNLTESQLTEYKTRKKPKGSFVVVKEEIKTSPFRKPIVFFNELLSNINLKNTEIYINEMQQLGFSFLDHPLEKHLHKIISFKDTQDGNELTTAGIIVEIIQKTTKTNKPFYNIMLKTPRELVKLILWDNVYKQYKADLGMHSIIIARGKKNYGGISADLIKSIKN